MTDRVVLVDSQDRPLGSAEKLQAHRQGWRHRAFSVFVYDRRGRLLLQQRHPGKYHSGGLWSNTCCSHPRPGESVQAAAHRRIAEEMGFSCSLQSAFRFSYEEAVGDGLVECEVDHIFIGRVDSVTVQPHDDEVIDWRWAPSQALRSDVQARPEAYTVWFRLLLARGAASPSRTHPD